MRGTLIALGVTSVFHLAFDVTTTAGEAPKILAWSNTKTEDEKTVFRVKPGEQITFSVRAEGAEKYLWLVDGAVQKGADAASLKWTVPNEKGMWKICVKTTNRARERWVAGQAVLWDKWVGVRTDRQGKAFPDEKRAFLQGMIEHRLYPLQAQKEWIVSTFLRNVRPGKSIQAAIDSVPAEGGIVALAPGVHEVNDSMYPPGAFRCVYKNTLVRYSVLMKRSNITIYGMRESVVRHHNKDVHCFLIPDLEAIDPDLYVENITFRGFTTASSYASRDRPRSWIVHATHVKNLTVEDIYDRSYAIGLAGVRSFQGHHRYSQNIFYKNNVMEHGHLLACFCKNAHVLGNVFGDAPVTWVLHIDRNTSHIYVAGNRVVKAKGAQGGMVIDSGCYYDVYDNVVAGTRFGLTLNHFIDQAVVEKNTITGTKYGGIRLWHRGTFNAVLVNNLIYDNRSAGIVNQEMPPMGRTCNVLIRNNLVHNNGGDGIRMRGKWVRSTIHNNTITDNKGHGISHASGKTSLSHNDVWNNAQGNYNGCAAGPGDFSRAPLFANPSEADFHLKSKTGRWDPGAGKWVKDAVHSPCIDAGDPKADSSREPTPNGGRVNVGAYGNTGEASKSAGK